MTDVPTFTYQGDRLAYALDTYNSTAFNERTVEIPVARRFIAKHGLTLEVGNVLRHYGHTQHRIIDRYDTDPAVENIDVFDISGHHASIVAISTLEHVRWDEEPKDPDGAIRALEHLVAISTNLLVTVPMGYHPALDTHLIYGDHRATTASTLVRQGDGWVQTDRPKWRRYGQTTDWAESVFVAEWT